MSTSKHEHRYETRSKRVEQPAWIDADERMERSQISPEKTKEPWINPEECDLDWVIEEKGEADVGKMAIVEILDDLKKMDESSADFGIDLNKMAE